MLSALPNDTLARPCAALASPGASPGASKARFPRKSMDDCNTPMSQMSTAPPTPYQSWMLPDPSFPEGLRLTRSISEDSTFDCEAFGLLPFVSLDDESECEDAVADVPFPVLSFGMPPLLSELAQRAQRILAAQEWMEKQLSDSDDDAADAREPVLSFGLQPLQSELGQRAQRIVQAQEWMEKQLSSSSAADAREPVLSFGLQPLQSELGQRAQRIVQAQEWMEKQLSSSSAADAREPVLSFGLQPLQSELGQRVQRIMDAQEWMERQLSSSSLESLLDDAAEEDEAAEPVVSFCMPPLLSELGQRAQRIVTAQEWMEKQLASRSAKAAVDDAADQDCMTDVPSCFSVDAMDELVIPVSFGMPPLESELGQRAQRIVAAKEWIDQQLSRADGGAAETA